MAFRIIWSQSAAEDLKEIVQFIARDNQDAACRLAGHILKAIETASDLPFSNRIVPEKQDESVREIILKPYRIIYRVDQSRTTVFIMRIWHAYRGTPEIN